MESPFFALDIDDHFRIQDPFLPHFQPSGGCSRQSYSLIAQHMVKLLQQFFKSADKCESVLPIANHPLLLLDTKGKRYKDGLLYERMEVLLKEEGLNNDEVKSILGNRSRGSVENNKNNKRGGRKNDRNSRGGMKDRRDNNNNTRGDRRRNKGSERTVDAVRMNLSKKHDPESRAKYLQYLAYQTFEQNNMDTNEPSAKAFIRQIFSKLTEEKRIELVCDDASILDKFSVFSKSRGRRRPNANQRRPQENRQGGGWTNPRRAAHATR
eukprot:TRINITY_DN2161_c2_g2_i1.p1 TRINITY_DN2161_c2_g2~~TRINITY_DN2161_c2_g2_i1.p1  ORF type:complete len:267 (+),score=66.89 TRINITY_DN2161_c2_g2_i1:279-1079(+)